MKNISEAFSEYASTGKIETKTQINNLECLKEIVRFHKIEGHSGLLKAADSKPITLIADFLFSLSQVLNEYAEKNLISQNKQTDIKTKMKEMMNIGQ